MKVLKLKDLIEMKTAVFMYNVYRKSLPSNLLAFFDTKKNKFYNLRSKSKEMFKLKYVWTEQNQIKDLIYSWC